MFPACSFNYAIYHPAGDAELLRQLALRDSAGVEIDYFTDELIIQL